jgi:hypothetical protein
VTTEQLIVIGIVAAAFLAGWIGSIATRRRDRRAADDLPPAPGAVVEPAAPVSEEVASPLAEEVGEALESDAANEGMLSGVRAERASLTELELDLADWGFTYGVAWARARERTPADPDDAVAAEALEAAQRVFRAYTAGDDWTRGADQRAPDRSNGSGQG